MPPQKNILILGVEDEFGDQIVDGLSAEDNSFILCGGDDQHQLSLSNRYPNCVKAYEGGIGLNDSHQPIQSMIEESGSLDAFIYLVDTFPSFQFLHQSQHQISQTLNETFITPICILQSIFPYLRKSANSKVMFVDAGMLAEKNNDSPIIQGGSYGLWGFCEGIKSEFRGVGIDVQSVSYPALYYSKEKRETTHSGSKLYEHYKKVITRILDFIRSSGRGQISQIPQISNSSANAGSNVSVKA